MPISPLYSIRMPKVKNGLDQVFGIDVKQVEFSEAAGRNVKWYSHFGKECILIVNAFPYHMMTPFLLDMYSSEKKPLSSYKDLYTNVHNRFV